MSNKWRSLLVYVLAIGAVGASLITTASVIAQASEVQPQLKAWSNVIPNANRRFVVLADFNNAAVFDRETGLVWERSPSAQFRTWPEAMGDCYAKTVGGRLGWRLSTIEELASLVDPAQTSPPLPPSGHPFTNVQAGGQLYWLSTSLFSTPPNAFAMRPFDGTVRVNIKALREGFVWCVRGGYGHAPDVLSE